jgi:uncharacterized protein
MQQLLQYILESITAHPEDINIQTEESEHGFIDFKVTVNPEDMGRVIGKSGRIIGSIRKILKVKAIKTGKRFNLEIVDPIESEK